MCTGRESERKKRGKMPFYEDLSLSLTTKYTMDLEEKQTKSNKKESFQILNTATSAVQMMCTQRIQMNQLITAQNH